MKNKKIVIKKNLLIAAIIVLILVAIDLLVMGIYAQKIPHHYSSAEE